MQEPRHIPYLAPWTEEYLPLPQESFAASGGGVDLDGQGLDYDFGGDW